MQRIANRRVLMVDDEPNVLSAIARNVGSEFELTTMGSGGEALEVLRARPQPFAVIISDMRMPEMDGAAFLARAKEISPTSTRFLLTGTSDIRSAMKAVNEGHIFRFLAKPCAADVLKSALDAGVEQHALVTAERDIMERTLSAVVKTLGDVLSLADPELFKRATVVKSYVSHVVTSLALEGGWQIEVAAALHTLGLVALPRELSHRTTGLTPLTMEEKRQLAEHPETARRILETIPRLEDVALIVAQQSEDLEQGPEWVRQGARLIRLAKRVEERVARGALLGDALEAVFVNASEEERRYLGALKSLNSERMEQKALRARELKPGMLLAEDLRTRDGALVLPNGHDLSAILIERLRQFVESRRVSEPIRVRIPSDLKS